MHILRPIKKRTEKGSRRTWGMCMQPRVSFVYSFWWRGLAVGGGIVQVSCHRPAKQADDDDDHVGGDETKTKDSGDK